MIFKVFYGEEGNYEKVKIGGKEYDQKMQELVESERVLRESIGKNSAVIENLANYIQKWTELSTIENEQFYVEGVRFGFLYSKDVYNKD